MLARLEPAAAALVDWPIDAALPLWATAGFDTEHGGGWLDRLDHTAAA
jgi:mannose/cellobiose epimerase-like protein (N-acyl-D-glucosamine 2-epimerase family)